MENSSEMPLCERVGHRVDVQTTMNHQGFKDIKDRSVDCQPNDLN